ncbi:uncharacterized protein ALTATR162_LOCUS6041 [Alternaria atra]|uniref:Uncharacterized protein n=1 Tax=Alternaria atra TaxID=119953 RepID=A0A8J2I2D5_9PLEO|nr:uncharacterized protein ALTATR162_LOCUS6041 [Alternaria atra]CAG5161497.1 unnamed protein product [Alternaria atra]
MFNIDCCGVWDASFEINGDKLIWKAGIHPAIIFFNFLLPADHMTDNILPLLEARLLLGGIPFQVAAALCEEYRDAREFLAPMYAADMAYFIVFLTRKRPDLKPFEVSWCAAHAIVQINLPTCEKYRKIPETIRRRIKRDAILAFRHILHNPTFTFVGPLLGHALRALEVYIQPLVTDSNPFVWVDAQFLHDLNDIHELSVDGAKARKTLFDYLQDRHPGVKTLWHSLVQAYNTYDVAHFPEYSTQPMSKPSLILWELFFRQARQDVPYEYPQTRPSALKRKNNSSILEASFNEVEQKSSKNKKKKPKGGKVVELVGDSDVPEQPASQIQAAADNVRILPPLPTVQEPPGKSEQKQSKKDKKKMKKKLKKLEALERTKSSAAKECQPSVIDDDGSNGGNVTGNKDDSGDSVVGNNDGDSIIGSNTNGDSDVCLTPAEDLADEASVNGDPAQEDSIDEEPATQNSKVSAANVYAGILAEKRTLHDSSGENEDAVEEDYVEDSDGWRKVEVRMKPQHKQKKHKDDRDISKDVPRATDSVPTGAKSLPAKAKASVPSAKLLANEAKSRPAKTKAPVPCQVIFESRKHNNNMARDQPTSWSALFEGSRDERRHASSQNSNSPTNTADAQFLATTGTESQESLQKDFSPLDRSSLIQSETSMGEEMSKSSAAYSTTALLPPGDDVPVDPPAVRETNMLHVEQWLTSKYASAFVGLTQAEIENTHWRPEQSNVTVVTERLKG